MILTTINYRSSEYESMCRLRDEVLRRPIGLRLTEEEQANDSGDILIGCMKNDEAIACCILKIIDTNTVKLRQMAVRNDCQGQGFGKKVLDFAETWSRNKGYTRIIMHARKTALGFYQKSGYITQGAEFTEVGIPHFEMIKML